MSMRFAALFPRMLVVALLGAFMLPTSVGAERSMYVFNTKLTGEAERPHMGDPDGKGKARIKIDLETGTICYSLRAKDIGALMGAHIHEITMDNGTGPVRQGLTPPTGGRSSGCVTNAVLAQAIVADPGDYYVNVHTTDIPAGAIRGDLR